MSKFDKPFRILPTIDIRKCLELFNLASKLDTYELLQFSLINQVPLDFVNDDGECLIHEVINIDPRKASQHAKLNVIKFLVQNKVNPDKPNKYNQTPLHLACNLQLDLIVEYLLSINCNPNFQDSQGKTPFHYLLTGYIKTIDTSHEVMDFIPPPKKKDVGKLEDLLKLKTLLWEMMQDPNKYPLRNTIQNTISAIIEEDPIIQTRRMETEKSLVKLALSDSPIDKTPEITQIVNLSRKKISDKILKLFDGFSDLDNFQIHEKEETSWSPIPTLNEGLIKDGNVKKVIKLKMRNIHSEIKQLSSDFKVINSISNNSTDNGFNAIFMEYLWNNVEISSNVDGRGVYMKKFKPDIFTEINDNFRHELAPDNASAIIDFENHRYIGGPREIRCIQTSYVQQLTDIFNLSEKQQILFMLRAPISFAELMKLKSNNILNDFKNFVNNNPNLVNNEITAILRDTGKAVWAVVTPEFTQFKADYFAYLYLSYLAIMEPTNINSIRELNSVPTSRDLFTFNASRFARKWYEIYMKGNVNLSSWIYNMWADLICKSSDSNLVGHIYGRQMMLLAGLQNYNTNKLRGIINAHKPHLIAEILNVNLNKNVALGKIIVLLITENVTEVLLNIMNTNHLDDTWISDPRISPILNNDIKYTHKLIYEFLQNNGDYDINPVNQIPWEVYYNNFSPVNKVSTDTLCEIILANIDNMENKPMKQTILDTIYFFRKLDFSNPANLNTSIDEFKKLTTNELFPVTPGGLIDTTRVIIPVNLSVTYSPSYYSVINYENEPNTLNTSNLIISHLLGLYYDGLVPTIYYDNNIDIDIFGNNLKSNHTISPLPSSNRINDNEIPFLLNFINLDPVRDILNYNLKYDYYDIHNGEFRSPSWHSYMLLLLSNIKRYQDKIVELLSLPGNTNSIINNLMDGKPSDLGKLYMVLHPCIVTYSMLLDNTIQQVIDYKTPKENSSLINKFKLFKDWIKEYTKPITGSNKFNQDNFTVLLNRMNSIFFIYYYIFSPGKLIKLPKFSYYQIPRKDPSPYYYYNNSSSKLVNIVSGEDIPQTTNPVTEDHKSSKLSGFLNGLSLGNYNAMLDDYRRMHFLVDMGSVAKSFIANKSAGLPPSLYSSLTEFYKYAIISLVRQVIETISNGKGNATSIEERIFNTAQDIIKTVNVKVTEYDLSIYNLICRLAQEIMKEKINFDLQRNIVSTYENISGVPPTFKIPGTLLVLPQEVKVDMTEIKLDIRKATRNLVNLYSVVMKSDKSNLFVLYPNDLTNINRLRSKYGIHINDKIIDILLKYQASPFITNYEGLTPIYPLLKNYKYDLVRRMKQNGIDFRNFNGESPIQAMIIESQNNLNKVLNYYKPTDNIKTLFENIDTYLYNDIKALIQSNEVFGNNILLYLPESFNICSYLSLQYLSEHLYNIDNVFTIDDCINTLSLFNISIRNMNKNYLGENLSSLGIVDDPDVLIAQTLYNEREQRLQDAMNKQKAIDTQGSINAIRGIGYLATRVQNSSLLQDLNSEITRLTREKQALKVITDRSNILGNMSRLDFKIIKRYRDLNLDRILTINAWEKLLGKSTPNNPNLVSIYLLEKYKFIIENPTPSQLNDLLIIKKAFEHLSKMGEHYFNTPKFTDENRPLRFVEDMLNYITELVIGNGIELMVRRVLLTYFSETILQPTRYKLINYDTVTEMINYILEEPLLGQTMSFRDQIYKVVCPKLVKNSANIFENSSEEQGHVIQPVRDIITNLFQQLENSPIKLPSEIMLILRRDVVNYFDTFTSRLITLWHVNFENILMFFINNYRCLETLVSLLE